MLKHLSLFSGIGGIDLAAHAAGFTTVAFCEREKFCQRILAKHWPGVPIYDNVEELSARALADRGIDPGSIDLISGGFPCQPYSSAGKHLGEEDDRALWPQMFRIITEVRPAWVLGENVTGFIRLGLDRLLSDLESAGYQAITFVIPACAVGAPHIRERVFVVATHAERRRRPQLLQVVERGGLSPHRPRGWEPSSTLDAGSNIVDRLERGSGQSAICGINDGLPNWLDRLRAVGNSVSPQQVYPVLKIMAEISRASV